MTATQKRVKKVSPIPAKDGSQVAERVKPSRDAVDCIQATAAQTAQPVAKRRRPQHLERIILGLEERRDRERAAVSALADRYITRKGVVRQGKR